MAKGTRDSDEFSLSDTAAGTSGAASGNSGIENGTDATGGGTGGINNAVDPAEAAAKSGSGGASGEGPKRGRGRPKGSSKKESVSPDVGAIEALLISIHTMMAIKIPEMAIEAPEAKLLAESIARVSAYYPGVTAIITGRMAAHAGLLMVIGQVYGTRIIAIQQRLKKEQNPPQGTVYDMATGKPYQPGYQ